jgi:protein-tyrosine phosphatase
VGVTAKHILFLCTGNYYRSRYAEEIFNHAAKSAGLGWRAFSRGLAEQPSSDNTGPMSRYALEALHAKAIIPLGAARFPLSCSLSDLAGAQLVIALKEAEHRPMLERRFPGALDKVEYWHVDDIEFAKPADALARIDGHVGELTKALQAQQG